MELVMCNFLYTVGCLPTVVRKSVSNRQRAQRSEYRFNNKGVRQMWIPQMQDARLWWPAIYIPFGRKRENVTARQSVHFALNWQRSVGIGVEGVVIMNCALFRRPLADGWDFGERIWSMIRMLYVSSLQFIKTNVQCLHLYISYDVLRDQSTNILRNFMCETWKSKVNAMDKWMTKQTRIDGEYAPKPMTEWNSRCDMD